MSPLIPDMLWCSRLIGAGQVRIASEQQSRPDLIYLLDNSSEDRLWLPWMEGFTFALCWVLVRKNNFLMGKHSIPSAPGSPPLPSLLYLPCQFDSSHRRGTRFFSDLLLTRDFFTDRLAEVGSIKSFLVRAVTMPF
ncbi:hypothetical protein COLO4_19866 [Corchorus olitorius]|uniref:Uncharacterized protein n=1 Tax=Corchorus olitorius TaxID=93759 RepID=A0A1R3J2Z5_9ROSI|nr:hypothetical protein COLO4_19866 [Corchorus olitorius]